MSKLTQIDGSSIKEVIEENIGKDFDFVAYADKVKSRPVKQRLFNCAETNDVNGMRRITFAKSGDGSIDWNEHNGAVTLMQMACIHGNEKWVLPSFIWRILLRLFFQLQGGFLPA